jgi:cysteine desulfurase / selenocysteine lyase
VNRRRFVNSTIGLVAGVGLAHKLNPLFGRGASTGTLSGQRLQSDNPFNPSETGFWSFVRKQFPLTDERTYLNTAGLGSSPFAVIEAVKAEMDKLEEIGETGHTDALWKEIKSSAGELLGCDADELAFVRNATEGINVVANGFPLKSGDEIITSTHEHIANQFTWLVGQKRIGYVLRFFEPSRISSQENLEMIEKLITSRTRLISLAHITCTTGQVMPVKEIADLARSRNIWFFMDGAQSAGMMPFNLHDIGCDAYTTSGHKWLLGPKETGLLYVRKEMLDTIKAKFVGAYSTDDYHVRSGKYTFVPSAERYEYGTVSTPLRVGLHAAVNFIRNIGIENVWKHDRMLAAHLYAELEKMPDIELISPVSDGDRSAMVTFRHRKLGYSEVEARLARAKFRTRGVGEDRLDAIRISTHIYNNIEEVDRLLDNIRELSVV